MIAKFAQATRCASIPGGGRPSDERSGDRLGKESPSLHHDRCRAHLDDDGRHPRFAQQGNGHPSRTQIGKVKRLGEMVLNQLCESPTAWRLSVVSSPVGAGTPKVRRLQTDADVHVDLRGVGLLGMHRVVGVVQRGDPRTCDDKPAPQGSAHCAEATHLADAHVTPCQGGGGLAEHLARPDCPHRLWLSVSGLQPEKLAQGCRAQNAISRQPDVALKVPERCRSSVAEDPVDAPTVKPESTQPLLQLGDVVTAQHWSPAIEESVSEQEARFDQCVPSLTSTGAINAQAPPMLEGFDRRPGRGTEGPVHVVGGHEPERRQPPLEVADRCPGGAFGQRKDALCRGRNQR